MKKQWSNGTQQNTETSNQPNPSTTSIIKPTHNTTNATDRVEERASVYNCKLERFIHGTRARTNKEQPHITHTYGREQGTNTPSLTHTPPHQQPPTPPTTPTNTHFTNHQPPSSHNQPPSITTRHSYGPRVILRTSAHIYTHTRTHNINKHQQRWIMDIET